MIPRISSALGFALLFGTGTVLDEKTLIPIGTGLAVGGLLIWVGRKLQSIDDKFQTLDDKFRILEEAQRNLNGRLSNLFCMRYPPGTCPTSPIRRQEKADREESNESP